MFKQSAFDVPYFPFNEHWLYGATAKKNAASATNPSAWNRMQHNVRWNELRFAKLPGHRMGIGFDFFCAPASSEDSPNALHNA